MEEKIYGNDFDNEKKQELLTRLQKVFRDGYRPTRGTESYSPLIDNYTQAYNVINCFGHVLNLNNQQLHDYRIIPYRTFGYLPGINRNSDERAKERLFDFIKAVGLKIEECDPCKPIEDFKSWKIALYFENAAHYKDFHFLLEEATNIWSSKVGYTSYLEHIYTETPPAEYRPIIDQKCIYNLYGTYKITNPNADENNPYVKNASHNPIIVSPENLKKRHCLIEGKKEDNYIKDEPLLFL